MGSELLYILSVGERLLVGVPSMYALLGIWSSLLLSLDVLTKVLSAERSLWPVPNGRLDVVDRAPHPPTVCGTVCE